jgi:hypothetical protein
VGGTAATIPLKNKIEFGGWAIAAHQAAQPQLCSQIIHKNKTSTQRPAETSVPACFSSSLLVL